MSQTIAPAGVKVLDGPLARGKGTSKHTLDKKSETPKYDEKEVKSRQLKFGGVALAAAGLLGFSFKDGLEEGVTRITDLTNNISHVASGIFAPAFPFLTLDAERAAISGESKSESDDVFQRIIYSFASIGFSPQTFGEPAHMLTRSKGHKIATLLNLPHLLFILFSYTGGRVMGALTAIKMKHNKEPDKKVRLEQEFESWYTLGNLGSSQASITPLAGQFITGWQNIIDVAKGDFGSAAERFKEEPVSAFLGTFFNSWVFPFDYTAKYFDTTIRFLESIENTKNAFGGNDSRLVRFLEKARDGWHASVMDKNSTLGQFLKKGREFAKVEALLGPPIGMVSVVTPAMNKFFRGEFWNQEAQEHGGIIAAGDKLFNTLSFLGHCYYTGVYSFSVRMPQFITTSTFYIANLMNKMRGIDLNKPGYSKQEGYIDPAKIRDNIFKPFKGLSDWAAKKLDKTEMELHDEPEWQLINDYADENGDVVKEGTGKCRHIRDFHKVVAIEKVFKPLRERLYLASINSKIEDPYKNKIKDIGEKPSDKLWGSLLKKERVNFIDKAENVFKDYLRKTAQLDNEQVEKVFREDYPKIKKYLVKLVDHEIETSINSDKPSYDPENDTRKIKSETLRELLTNPTELLEAVKLKTFHVTNTILPLWVKGFVNVVDYGSNEEPFWKRNLKATVSGINEGDIKQATDREFLPVVMLCFQNASKGWTNMSKAAQAIGSVFGMAA